MNEKVYIMRARALVATSLAVSRKLPIKQGPLLVILDKLRLGLREIKLITICHLLLTFRSSVPAIIRQAVLNLINRCVGWGGDPALCSSATPGIMRWQEFYVPPIRTSMF
ncbi:hypothetical protein NC651_004827 [Populus alba x Populus x berolinensis]|nr:hypothetical protein NC651_004827 [Populus alba x Populus x berolinensis]